MDKIKKSYTINWSQYGSYISWQQMLLKEMHTEITNINNILKSLAMAKGVWYDDNAASFVKWYRSIANGNQGYDKAYDTLKSYYSKTVGYTCRELKKIEPESYKIHGSVKSYGDTSSIYDVLGTKYKTTNTKNIFAASQEAVAKGVATTAVKTKVNPLLSKLDATLNELQETAELYGKADLSFFMGMKGISVEGLGSGSNSAGEVARKVPNLTSTFTKTFKTKLNAALKKSGLSTI